MKKTISYSIAALALTSSAALAGGIDRSGQGIGFLFEKGTAAELSFGMVTPSVTGTDTLGGATGNVGKSYTQTSLSYKMDIGDNMSFALIMDQPFGADVEYAATSVLLGGTKAVASSTAVTGILRYKFDGGFSAHAGLRAQTASANIDLRGLAFGPSDGYSVDLASDTSYGYLVGVAYEKPEIALRVALTFNSAITHQFATTETFLGAPAAPPSVTNSTLPKSINLDFQSGVAANTLVFGSIRWVDWSAFKLAPSVTGSLIDLSDSTTYNLGVGRKFNDNWSGAFSMSYEAAGNPLVSPLAPTNGKLGFTLAGVYKSGNFKITTGINYTKVGDASPQTAGVARASMTGNSAWGIGVKLGLTF